MSRVRRIRTVRVAPATETGAHAGLAYALWLPEREPRGGVVVLHGAGSCKENHHDFARAAFGAGFAAVAFDQRGHGDSDGPMDGRAIDDVATIAAMLRRRVGGEAPIALRGSSMGGYLAIVAGAGAGAAAVVAICPAPAQGLRRALARSQLGFDADREELDALLAAHELERHVAALTAPLLLLHAEGDEQVPVEHSRELAKLLVSPASRLVTVPGGHHRSIQHDGELQALSLRFIERALAERATGP